MHIYFIRHGQSFVNLKDWPDGNVDVGLTDLGNRQAGALAEWLPAHVEKFDAIYASTMMRAQETAGHVSAAYGGIEIRSDDRLREVGNNRRDHTPWPNDNLPKKYAEYWSTARPFAPIMLDAEGNLSETYMHFRTRVGAFVEEMTERHVDETIAIVCHGGVVDVAFDHIFNLGAWRRCEVWDYNTGITYFQFIKDSPREVWRLHYHNRTDHLIGVS